MRREAVFGFLKFDFDQPWAQRLRRAQPSSEQFGKAGERVEGRGSGSSEISGYR